MGLNFPNNPVGGQKFPASPIAGVPTYTWDGEKWRTVAPAIGGGGGGGGALPSDVLPHMDGTAAAGVSGLVSRDDHIHPSDTTRVAKTGDTMTGQLTVVTPPVSPAHAASKAYVDSVPGTPGAPGAQGPQGIPGPQGPKGDTGASGTGSGDMLAANNLSDVANKPTALANIGGTSKAYVDGGDATLQTNINAKADKSYVDSQDSAIAATIPAAATAAEYLSNSAPTKMLTPGAAWSAAAPVTLTAVANVATPDMGAGIDFAWTLGAVGQTLANPANKKVGQKGLIYLTQDGTGSRTITTWGSQYKFPGGTKPTLSTAASSVDTISYAVKSATEIHCVFLAGMA